MPRKCSIAPLLALTLAVTGGTLVASGPAAAAPATGTGTGTAMVTETRQFVGEGSSSWGFSLYYARAQARSRANEAGFADCTEIYMEDWYYYAMVIWECTR